jgi:hypothetical protein
MGFLALAPPILILAAIVFYSLTPPVKRKRAKTLRLCREHLHSSKGRVALVVLPDRCSACRKKVLTWFGF